VSGTNTKSQAVMATSFAAVSGVAAVIPGGTTR
jgi:hypothetical protein